MDVMFDRLFQEMPLRLTVFLGHGRELFVEFGVDLWADLNCGFARHSELNLSPLCRYSGRLQDKSRFNKRPPFLLRMDMAEIALKRWRFSVVHSEAANSYLLRFSLLRSAMRSRRIRW
jgi:hypothetical protein